MTTPPLPLVSVIVPTRNSARFLGPCLTSIELQTYPHIEVVVVDNYSTDATTAIARNAGARVLFAGPERSAQVNYGVRHSRGEFVFRVDSDFYLDPDVISQCVALVASGDDAVVVHNTPLIRGTISRIRKFEVDMYKYSLDHSAPRFLRRSSYLEVGGYTENITAGEDYDLQNKLARIGTRIGFCEAEALHLDEPLSIWPVLVKFFRYGQDFPNYSAANPEQRSVQLAFVRRDFIRHRQQFVEHPALGLGLAIYHSAKYFAGGIGYAASRLAKLGVWGPRKSVQSE
jgi:glycosyltransferase involved in cell wall biosynthesis